MDCPMDGSPSRKRGMFAQVDPDVKRLCTFNPEYTRAFSFFDADSSGTIDIKELNAALQAVKESMGKGQFFPQPFNPRTVLWLAARFAASGGGIIGFQHFAEMMQYLEGLKRIFEEIDVDRSGDINVSELSCALNLSGFSITGMIGSSDPLSLIVAERIGRAYDADGNGVLSFDEFVQLRLEWDCYLEAWCAHVPEDSETITPQELLAVLDGVKRSFEPVGTLALNPTSAGLNTRGVLAGLLYSSMFKVQRPFQTRTAELLIVRFGGGSHFLNFEQFCMLMEFLKEQTAKFVAADTNGNGAIDLMELGTAFAISGLPMPIEALIALGRRYDQDNSGVLEFDEFLQMMAELKA